MDIKNGGLYLTTKGLMHVDIVKKKEVEYVFTDITTGKSYNRYGRNETSFDDIMSEDFFTMDEIGKPLEEIKVRTAISCLGDKLFNEVGYNFDGYDIFNFVSTNKKDNMAYMQLVFIFTLKSDGNFRNGPSIVLFDKETGKENMFHLGRTECELECFMDKKDILLKRITMKIKGRTIYAYFKKSNNIIDMHIA